jgi:MFS family permease
LCGLIGAFFYSMLNVPSHLVPRPQRTGWRDGWRGVEHVMSNDKAYSLFQYAFFLSGSAFFMSTHIILYLTHQKFGFDAFELALWMSVVPQLLLTLASPAWGRILDRHGIVHCRLLISLLMMAYMGSYLMGIVSGVAWLIYLGSVLQGLANSGGQLTWLLASSHFAPRVEDVPLYNGIHFVLNGVRGLVMPWMGSIILVTAGGPWAIFSAILVTLTSVPIIVRGLKLDDERNEPVLRVVPAAGEEAGELTKVNEKSAG